MLTFQDQCSMFQQITGDYTSAGLVLAKRDINEGGTVFLNRLGRKYNHEYEKTDLKANKQYYQMRSAILRPSELRFLNGSYYNTATLITDEAEWNGINVIATTGNYIMFYYVRGSRELGVYPIPAADVTNGIIMSAEPQHVDLTQDDFILGTATVNKGTIAITHSASGFTQNMVGRWFQVTDATDGKWYRIASYVSNSVLNLENYYEGIGGSGRTFRIGEVMKIPPGYQDAPVYYACERFYMMQNDQRTAPIFAQRFQQKLINCKETYARSTSRMGIKTSNQTKKPLPWIYLTPPIQYP